MINSERLNNDGLDYLIRRSGIIGRQILRIARWIHKNEQKAGPRGQRTERFTIKGFFVSIVIFLYTYYIGGSLTRSDQIAFSRLCRMGEENAFKLTLINSLACGIPCAAGYFLLGEGFDLLSSVHSYTEIPALLAKHTSLAIGAASLAVDLFRAADSSINRRCWAPFGFLPFVINLPTYLKKIFGKKSIVK